MMLKLSTIVAIAGSVLAASNTVLAASSVKPEKTDLTKYVDTLIGTAGKGHVFPGATVPFGMAKPCADSADGDAQGGYNADSKKINGFSQMHDDGTGGGYSLGVFPLMPMQCDDDDILKCEFNKTLRAKEHSNAKGTPGYFSVDFDDMTGEVTSTRRTALHRFTFKKGAKAPVVLVDLADLSDSRHNGVMQIDKKKSRVTGQGNFNPSFGIGTYDMYFCADFKGAKLKDNAVYYQNRAGSGDSLNVTDNGQYELAVPAGGLLQFDSLDEGGQLEARVGLSYISSQQACENAESEAGNWDFDQTHQDSVDQWNEYLNRIQIGDLSSQNKSDVENFYSSFYRVFINPQNNTGENPLWESDEPNYTSFYCIWDTFRTNFPLYSVVAPKAEVEMIRSLLDIQKHKGWMPDCRMTTNQGYTQGGSNADNVLADAYLKGVGKELNWEELYQALVKDAEYEPPDWSVQGRGGIESWKKLNYIPAEDFDILGSGLQTRSASRTIEYAYNDFCISQVAKGLGKKNDCKKYLERSHYWKNLWNEDTESLGFKGFIQPKYSNGTWGKVDPRHCSPAFEFGQCYLNPDGGEFYEAAPWTYSLLMAHDYAGLIELLGGDEAVAPRLDAFFHKGMQDVGDEIGWMNTYLGHYSGNTSIAIDRVHEWIPEKFHTGVDGIVDNDDSGAMGAFVVMNMAGYYPNAGQDIYLISSPFFEEVSFYNEDSGKTSKISAKGTSSKNRYIQSAKLNGEDYDKPYFTHDFFTTGGHLELEMGDKPSTWGSKHRPPSVSTGGYTC